MDLMWDWLCKCIGNFICIFSFSYSTSVTLGDAVVIFGGYDNGHPKDSGILKQIGKVIKSNRKSNWLDPFVGGSD